MDQAYTAKARVLLIDDDVIFCEFIQHVFSLIEAEIVTVTSLTACKSLLTEREFDVVLLDNMLPDGRGVELMPFIMALKPAPTVLMITADEDIDNIKLSFERGVSDYMVKPINTDLLLHKVTFLYKNLLNERALEKTNAQLRLAQEHSRQEERLAQHVYNSLVGASNESVDGVHIMQMSHSDFCGDFLFTIQSNTGNRYVFLMDAMGHGLAAAICILPLIATAKAMATKNLPLLTIMHEINAKLTNELPDDRFVSLAAIEVDYNSEELLIFNAGLPPILLHTADNTVETVASSSMPMGILETHKFSISPSRHRFDKVRQVALFSDGLIEQRNAKNEMINMEGIINVAEQLIRENASWADIENTFTQHLGDQERDDDISLCVIDCEKLARTYQTSPLAGDDVMGELQMSMLLQGSLLRSVDVIKFLSGVMAEARIEPQFANRAFTVIAELYNNGLDHGVLGLDSKLKNDIEGFGEYLLKRDENLSQLSKDDCISVSLRLSGANQIEFEVEDSGSGFEHQSVEPSDGLSGRGLGLVEKLSTRIERNDKGNKVKVVLNEREGV